MSSLSPTVRNLLTKNASFTKTFTPLPSIQEYAKQIAANPSTPRTCIICCSDPRVIPEQIFGLSMGEAIVVRVAGGNIQPALSSVVAIGTLAAFTDIIVMRHTDCGTTLWTDEKIKGLLQERGGGKRLEGRRGESVQDMGFCESVGDMEQLLKEDVEWLKNSPLISEETKKSIVGAMFVTETGEVKIVC